MSVEEEGRRKGDSGFGFYGFNVLDWGSFKIAGITLLAVSLLLLFRDSGNIAELAFIQSLIKFAIGSSVIGYGQSLLYTNRRLLTEAKDLPTWVQIIFIVLHAAWFLSWLGCTSWPWS